MKLPWLLGALASAALAVVCSIKVVTLMNTDSKPGTDRTAIRRTMRLTSGGIGVGIALAIHCFGQCIRRD